MDRDVPHYGFTPEKLVSMFEGTMFCVGTVTTAEGGQLVQLSSFRSERSFLTGPDSVDYLNVQGLLEASPYEPVPFPDRNFRTIHIVPLLNTEPQEPKDLEVASGTEALERLLVKIMKSQGLEDPEHAGELALYEYLERVASGRSSSDIDAQPTPGHYP